MRLVSGQIQSVSVPSVFWKANLSLAVCGVKVTSSWSFTVPLKTVAPESVFTVSWSVPSCFLILKSLLWFVAGQSVTSPTSKEFPHTVIAPAISVLPVWDETLNLLVPSAFSIINVLLSAVRLILSLNVEVLATVNVPGKSTLVTQPTAPEASLCITWLLLPLPNLVTSISAAALISTLTIVPSLIWSDWTAPSLISQVCINWSSASSNPVILVFDYRLNH